MSCVDSCGPVVSCDGRCDTRQTRALVRGAAEQRDARDGKHEPDYHERKRRDEHVWEGHQDGLEEQLELFEARDKHEDA